MRIKSIRAADAAASLMLIAAVDADCLRGDDAPARRFRSEIAALERDGVPVLAWSGRTRAEVEVAREWMGLRGPFVSENGGALFVPNGYYPFSVSGTRSVPGYDVIEFGARYEQVTEILLREARTLHISVVAFGSMTTDEVASELHLPLREARLAKLREYGEIFKVENESQASRGRLFRALHAAGLTCVHGDRYDVVTGVSDRGAAVRTACRMTQQARGRVVKIGMGSHTDDLPVLVNADVRVIVPGADRQATSRLCEQSPSCYVIERKGAEGWLEAIARVRASV